MAVFVSTSIAVWASLFILIAISWKAQQVEAGKPRVALQFHDMEKCKGVQPPFEFKNATVVRSKLGSNSINVDFDNQEVMKTASKLELAVTRCSDAVSFNTCEYEATLKYSVGLCQLIGSQTMPWYSILSSMHPPARCPLLIGPYQMRNGTVDMTSVVKFTGTSYLEQTFGKIFMTVVRIFNEKGSLHVCFTVRYSFMRVRN
ncbi:uncharacterized protein LOC117647082 [Thrips palmi]|uniref:Uncharacterized protein LOC117647082 n=1 Tax=Thrips palmi TaxID=161013 RepID=A0A6P8YWI6_THRPL|nr:uncharacterized protein LOC117647082 [Thrips palmi]